MQSNGGVRRVMFSCVLVCVAVVGQAQVPVKALYVSPNGNDQATGESLKLALRTPSAAVAQAEPGTAVYFDAGTYPPLKIVDKKGTAAAPIVFAAVSGRECQATFSTGKIEAGTAISVGNSSYIILRNLRAANSQKGIDLYSVSNCIVERNLVEQLGQEGIHVGRDHTWDDPKRFLGPPSEAVRVIGNTVRATGKWKAAYGEGIYIGSGALRGDDTHDVLIANNALSDIAAEGMELKAGSHHITVRGNSISNTHHEYNGAITVALVDPSPENGAYVIENNLIWDIKKVKHDVAGIAVGHGDTVIRNNIIWGVECGIGIRVYQTFTNPKALSVLIENNTVWCAPGGKSILLNDGTGGGKASPLKAKVTVKNTCTADGTGGSSIVKPNKFVGPLTGSADAGEGPGSGFCLKGAGTPGANYAELSASMTAKAASGK